ncbi:hypothetical protein KM043_010675 [Ampulex compressa]|nr:hypothetical protein KM043_010675 [Ampulex compressa]
MSVRTIRVALCTTIIALSILYLYTSGTPHTTLENKNVISLKTLLAAAIRAAEVGGFEVVAVHDQTKLEVESKGKTKEGVNDPVTAADYRSHCAMYHSLLEAFPKITVISEETSKNCNKVVVPDIKSSINDLNNYDIGDDTVANASDITVWIDPLDATKEFTENLLHYVTTMVCVAVNGKPIIGVIYKPFETKLDSNLYWTWTNHGTSENLKNLPKVENGAVPILIVSRSHAGKVYNISKNALGKDVEIISAAGAGYKFLEVAAGNATAYVHMTAIKKWDICAGTAILNALGGSVTQLFDQESLSFGPSDPKVVTSGLLATMTDHKWYLHKLSKI